MVGAARGQGPSTLLEPPAGVCSQEGPSVLGWTMPWLPISRVLMVTSLGTADLSIGREVGELNGWPDVASSLSFSVISGRLPHSLLQATGLRQKCRHGHVGGGGGQTTGACFFHSHQWSRGNLPLQIGARRYPRLAEAPGCQRRGTSPQLRVLPTPLGRGGRNVVRSVPPLLGLRGGWK